MSINSDQTVSRVGGLVRAPYAAHMKCLRLVGENRTVLDVGCAAGYLAAELKKKGCFVVGLEKRADLAGQAAGRCDEVIAADVETIELPYKKHFDAILFADCLSFFRQPAEVLVRFREYLKEDGFIVLSVPNIANWSMRLSLLLGRFDYRPTGILDAGHIRFFTARTLKDTIVNAGFTIDSFDITVNLRGANRFGLIRRIGGLWKEFFGYQFIIKASICRK